MSRLTVISNPTDIENELELIHALFENGMECFHLRKPEKTKNELETFLKKINPKYYKRVVIHSHYSLIEKYNLKGIHFPERYLLEEDAMALVKPLQKKGCSVSCSIHAISTISSCKMFNYVFLSPVFDSISKKDYRGTIDLDELRLIKKNNAVKVIALGGISSETFTNKIHDAGFDGIAVLGSIWNKNDREAIEEFVKINSIARALYNV